MSPQGMHITLIIMISAIGVASGLAGMILGYVAGRIEGGRNNRNRRV